MGNHRWTKEDLETFSDEAIMTVVLNERMADLNREGFLYKRLRKIVEKLGKAPASADAKPIIICCVEGGVFNGAKASIPIDVEVLDYDNYTEMEGAEREEFDALEDRHIALPYAVY